MKAWLILLVLIFSTSAYAQLYADVTFDVLETGEVKISGDTNYEKFQGTTNELTFKHGNNWTFILSEPMFDEYVYSIKLPKNAKFGFVETDSQTKIETEDGRLVVTAAGINKEILMILEYTIDQKERTYTTIRLLLGIALIVILTIVLRRRLANRHDKFDRKRFTKRQLTILDYIAKKGHVTQAQLEKDLKLPKSSLSRNIRTLVQKGVISKERSGMSNILRFK